MGDMNPPKERGLTDRGTDPARYQILRSFGSDDEHEAEAVYLRTWDYLNRNEPDASRRAELWLMANRIGADYDAASVDGVSVEGAHAAGAWIRSMCRNLASYDL
jgi:hypothetical protein